MERPNLSRRVPHKNFSIYSVKWFSDPNNLFARTQDAGTRRTVLLLVLLLVLCMG